MSQRLFNVGKVGVLLDGAKWGIEKRRGEVVTVLLLDCRVQPFDNKLASALDSGIGDKSNVKRVIFNMNTGDPVANFTGHEFTVSIPRQNLEVFATPDTEAASLMIPHVKVRGGFAVKAHGDNPNALTLSFKMVFGPCSAHEFMFVNGWFRGQRFVTFSEAEASLAFQETVEDDDEEAPEATDADIKARQPALPAHDFDTDRGGKPTDAPATVHDLAARRTKREPANRPLHRHATGKKARARK